VEIRALPNSWYH